jgi:hypothetical protein
LKLLFFTINGVDVNNKEYTDEYLPSVPVIEGISTVSVPSKASNPEPGLLGKVQGVIDDISKTQVGSAVLDSLSATDSAAFLGGKLAAEQDRLKRYLQPSNLTSDALSLATGVISEFVDNQVKRLILNRNLFEDQSGLYSSSTLNIINGLNLDGSSLNDRNIFDGVIHESFTYYSLGKKIISSFFGNLSLANQFIGDLTFDQISQVYTLGTLVFERMVDNGLSEADAIEVASNVVSTRYGLDDIDLGGNFADFMRSSLESIKLTGPDDFRTSLGEVVSPEVMIAMIESLGDIKSNILVGEKKLSGKIAGIPSPEKIIDNLDSLIFDMRAEPTPDLDKIKIYEEAKRYLNPETIGEMCDIIDKQVDMGDLKEYTTAPLIHDLGSIYERVTAPLTTTLGTIFPDEIKKTQDGSL